MSRLILHLGSNLGDRREMLKLAIIELEKNLGSLVVQSSYYETAPWLGPNPSALPKDVRTQKKYLNIALQFDVSVSPFKALDICMNIETSLGRERKYKWGARAIDIDLIYYDDIVLFTARLVLPHPWMQDRRFVLTPLTEIIPQWKHPLIGKTTQQLLKECKDDNSVEII